jgi:hypothetical protein
MNICQDSRSSEIDTWISYFEVEYPLHFDTYFYTNLWIGECRYVVYYIVTGRCHSTDADLVSAVTNADIVTATTVMHCDWVEAFHR